MSSDAPDTLTRFLLPAAGVRGVAVRLDAAWDAVAGRADYPPAARELLGEAAAAAVLFTGHTKVDGRLSIQIRGQRGLRTLFAECTAAGTVRGIVQLTEGQDAPRDLRDLGRDALLAITIENPGLDPREPQRYQSLVGLDASRLAEAFAARRAQWREAGFFAIRDDWLARAQASRDRTRSRTPVLIGVCRDITEEYAIERLRQLHAAIALLLGLAMPALDEQQVLAKRGLHRARQHRGAILADRISDGLVGQLELLTQGVVGFGFFDRIQIFALQVFDQ